MKEILSVRNHNIVDSYKPHSLLRLVPKNKSNLEGIVNIINNNTTPGERKSIFGVYRKVTILDVTRFIKQPNSDIHIKKMQELVEIINNEKSKNLSMLKSKPLTIKDLLNIINNSMEDKNHLKTKKDFVSKSAIAKLEATPLKAPISLTCGNALSLNEIE
jgi:hypothetical protein